MQTLPVSIFKEYVKQKPGNFLVVQWLGLVAFIARAKDQSSAPDWLGIDILQASWHTPPHQIHTKVQYNKIVKGQKQRDNLKTARQEWLVI